MKIGISTSVIQRGKTGIAQYLFALLRAFDALPTTDRYVLFVLDEDRPLFRGLSHRFQIVPVAEKYRPAVQNILWHHTILPGLIRVLDIDVMHIPSYRRMIAAKPCAMVATIHDLAPFRVSGKYDPARMLYGRVVVKQLARRQDRIIAVSGNTANDLYRFFGVPASRVRVVHNGLEHSRFFPQPASSVSSCLRKFALERPFILYVARLEHPGKNHVRLIQAFEKFKAETKSDWLLALGGSDWHGAEVIHQAIDASAVRADIRKLGFVSDADLPALYTGAALFAYPSLYEGFGMPPLEAMACGVPVISSDKGSLGEVVGDAAEIVEPESVDSIAAALSRLCLDSQLRENFRAKGVARAQEFSWNRAARETLAVYEAALRVERNGAKSSERPLAAQIIPK